MTNQNGIVYRQIQQQPQHQCSSRIDELHPDSFLQIVFILSVNEYCLARKQITDERDTKHLPEKVTYPNTTIYKDFS